jgi:hypothetical protein
LRVANFISSNTSFTLISNRPRQRVDWSARQKVTTQSGLYVWDSRNDRAAEDDVTVASSQS